MSLNGKQIKNNTISIDKIKSINAYSADNILSTDGSEFKWISSSASSKVESVTGTGVDNSDPINPTISIDKDTIGLGNVDNIQQIPLADKGANNGVAELDSSGKVPVSQLPSYVSDVETYPTLSSFPTTGDDNIIYITEDTNLTYRWTGSTYVEISPSIALGETSSTAYRGDRGKVAYDHSQVTSGNPHNVTKTDVGLGSVPNTNFTSAVNANTTKRTYPLVDENKLSGVEANAQKNVKSDWNASSGDAQILNKPINLSNFNNDVGYLRTAQIDNKSITFNNVNQLQAVALEVKHGTSADFRSNQVVYSHTNPGTGAILQVLATFKLGVCNKIYHSASSEPTYPWGWVKLGDGQYEPNQLNIIFAEYCGDDRVEYWIVQEN